MIFSHDTENSLECLVDLVNSSPELGGDEQLPDVASLRALLSRHRVSEVGPLGDEDLAAVHALRERLYAIFLSSSEHELAARINAIITEAPVQPRLTDHDDYDWHMHYFTPGAALPEHLAVDGAIALAQVMASGERDRLRVCDAPDCSQVLVDLSRNRSKRYCDARTCGNRLHVAAYRERRRAAAG
ncbi:MAG: CGNR zinc finger domain-containing protein [Actinomycetota bacterium]|nr:CGNR zinc finger domain-containing protein [Actinomycetota bacterium]